MSSEFESDLNALRDEMAAARQDTLTVLDSLFDSDLDLARRGGWDVRRTLEHVIQSEWMYITVLAFLNDAPAPERPDLSLDGAGIGTVVSRLNDGRRTLLRTLESVTEDRFYSIQRVGHEEYSPFSVLENVANHDREHAEQIRTIIAASRR